MYLLAQAFWFLLPALTSNMAPVLAKNISALDRFNKPIDAGRTLRGKPLLGKNKTYRGFVAGVILAVTTGVLQWILSDLFPVFDRLGFTDLLFADYLVLSVLLGFGALLGDAVESFFERQLDIPSGSAWTPFDQLDFIIGASVLSTPYVSLTLSQFSAVLFVGMALHLVTVMIGYKLGIRDAPI